MMQNILLWSFMFGISQSVYAGDFSPKEAYSDFKCQKEVEKELQAAFAAKNPEWDRVADTDFETQTFRAPGNIIGEWYELHITEKKTPSLFFYSSAKTMDSHWNNTCKLITKKGPGFEFFKALSGNTGESFTDSDLAKLIQNKKSAVIYLWSPRMVYSVTEFNRFRAVIEKRKMEFIPILDSMVDVAEAKAAMKKAGVELINRTAATNREPSSIDYYKRLNSVDLYMRNGSLHFPTLFVVANGKIHPRRIVGVLTNDGLNDALNEWMTEIK